MSFLDLEGCTLFLLEPSLLRAKWEPSIRLPCLGLFTMKALCYYMPISLAEAVVVSCRSILICFWPRCVAVFTVA